MIAGIVSELKLSPMEQMHSEFPAGRAPVQDGDEEALSKECWNRSTPYLLCIDLFRVVRSKEPVTVQPPRCHQHENRECRIAETETSGQLLCKQSNDQVYGVNMVVVYLPDFLAPDHISVSSSKVRTGFRCNSSRKRVYRRTPSSRMRMTS